MRRGYLQGDDAAPRRSDNGNPVRIDKSELGKIVQRAQRIGLPGRQQLVAGFLDAPGGKAIHCQRNITPARHEFSDAIAGIFRQPVASMEIYDGSEGAAALRFRQVALNRLSGRTCRYFAALARLALLDLANAVLSTVEPDQFLR